MSRLLQVVAVCIMFAGPSLGARLKLDEKRLAQNDANPFGDMMGMMGPGGMGFPGDMGLPGGMGFPGMGGNRAPTGGDFIAPIGDLSKGTAPEFPIAAACFTADSSMKVPIFPMVMQGTISYDGNGKRVRTDVKQFGRSAGYEIALEPLNCKLKVDPQGNWEIEQLNGQFPTFQLIPGAIYKGTQKVDGVDCYRYQFKFVFDIELWVSAARPHVPVYMSLATPMIGTVHHHLKNHQIVDDCNFDDSLFDAPQCMPSTTTTTPTTTTTTTSTTTTTRTDLVENEVFGSVYGNPIIFVIDESGSMGAATGRSRRTVCREELETVLKSLPETTKINVIPFSGSALAVFTSPVPATSENVNKAMAKVRAFSSGSTNSEAALKLAYGMHTSSADDPQVYFLSDGAPDQSADTIFGRIPGWDNGRKIKVNTIVVGGGGRDFMHGLATKTGGSFKEINV
jgi:hypothetical protein